MYVLVRLSDYAGRVIHVTIIDDESPMINFLVLIIGHRLFYHISHIVVGKEFLVDIFTWLYDYIMKIKYYSKLGKSPGLENVTFTSSHFQQINQAVWLFLFVDKIVSTCFVSCMYEFTLNYTLCYFIHSLK